jgi:methoxymalonate biosynthesis acyl carrier protein
MTSIETVKNLVNEYIMDHVKVKSLSNDEKIFESGLVNSLFAIQLMSYLEQTFAIKIDLEDLDMSNFESVDAISSFVSRKQGGQV